MLLIYIYLFIYFIVIRAYTLVEFIIYVQNYIKGRGSALLGDYKIYITITE